MVAERTGREPTAIPFGPGLVTGATPGPRPRFTFLHRTTWHAHKRFVDLLLAVRELARGAEGRFVVRSACDPRTAFAREFSESARDRELLEEPAIASHVELASFGPAAQRRLDGDAVVVPSTTESFCFPIAEAVGARVPVLAADTGFARELCGEGAFYARPADPSGLAEGMRRLIDGERPPPVPPEIRARISWSAHTDGLAALCHSLAAGERTRP